MDRILIISNDDIGLYNFRKELLLYYLNNGTEVHISVPYGIRVDDLIKMGCVYHETPVDRRGKNPLNDFSLIYRYLIVFQKVKPQCIISYTIKPNMYGGIAARIVGIPFYPYVAGLGTPFQKKGLISTFLIVGHRIAFKKSSVVFFENVDSMAFYKKHKIARGKCVKIPGAGVNLDEYAFKEMPNIDHIEFVFIGRVMKEKGIDELLEASKRIKRAFPDTVINIVGSCEEDYAEKLEKFQMQGIIKYWGFQKDVKPIVYNSHCLVLPSYHEGMANVLLEAAAMGRVLITSDIHGCKEAVGADNGFLISPRSDDDLFDAMKQVCLMEHSELEIAGIRSRKHMERVFSRYNVIQTMTNRIV